MGKELKPRDHVFARGRKWTYRRRVPLDLVAEYGGKKEIVESLRTSDLKTANERAALRTLELDQEFAHKRALKAAQPEDSLADEEIERIAKLWGVEALEIDDYWRAIGFVFGTEGHREGIDNYLPEWREAYAEGNIAPALDWTRKELARHGIKLLEKSHSFRVLALAILAEAIRVHEIMLERLDGVPIPTPKAQPVVLRGQRQAPATEPLAALVDYWRLQKTPRERTVQEASFAVQEFERINGAMPVSAYAKAHAVAFRDSMLRDGRSKPATVKKKMNLLGAIFATAAADDRIAANPFAGVLRPETKNSARRHPYTQADLRAIFQSRVFTDTTYRPTGGAGEAAFWLPLLALWTGARLEELGQLLSSDARESDGIPFLSLMDDGDGTKRFKNHSSQRLVPLHPELLRLGFLDYVAAMRGAGHDRLFPLVRSSGNRQITASFSQWWGRYARDVAGITDPAKTFHSFRHSFADAGKNSGVPREVRFALMGHTGEKKVGDGYGTDLTLGTLATYMQRVSYTGLDLSHLQRSPSKSGGGSRSTRGGRPVQSQTALRPSTS